MVAIILGGGGTSAPPLTPAQATNTTDTNYGTVSGSLLNSAVKTFQNAGMAGSFDPLTFPNSFPPSVTLDGVLVRQGDYFIATNDGTVDESVLNGPKVKKGSQIIALKNSPSSASDWSVDNPFTIPSTATSGVETPVTADGQTSFNLLPFPSDTASVVMLVNGQELYQPEAFTISGSTVTWMNLFALKTTDEVRFRYL